VNRSVKCSKAFFRIRGKVRHTSINQRLRGFTWCHDNTVDRVNDEIAVAFSTLRGSELDLRMDDIHDRLVARLTYLRAVWKFNGVRWDWLSAPVLEV
jgi:hypothetical protein